MLTREEIQQKIERRRSKGQDIAAEQERRISFHGENGGQSLTVSQEANNFLLWVKNFITTDNYRIFLHLFRYPLPSSRLSDEIYSQLKKIKDGVNPVRDINFSSDEIKNRAIEYIEDNSLEEKLFEDLWLLMKTKINSVIVVDMPSEASEDVEPYWYGVDVTDLIEWSDNTDYFDYVIYKSGEDQITVIDEGSYQVWQTDGLEIKGLEPISFNTHELGYCPAFWFWSENLGNSCVKKHPLSLYLDDLDWFLFYSIAKRHLDLYAPYPIYWGFDTDCDYNDSFSRECRDGYLVNAEGIYLRDKDGLLNCPKCSSNLGGAGAYVSVPVPVQGDPSLTPPVGKVDIDVNAVKHNSEEVKRLAESIYNGVTGNEFNVISKEAVNETQVMSLFESAETVLISLQRNFEKVEEKILYTILKLKYDESLTGVYISYGTSHYIHTPSMLLQDYTQGLKDGLPDNVLNTLQERWMQSKYRNNPEGFTRAYTLMQLEPFRHLNKTQVSNMYAAGVIDYSEYMLKMNFGSYIMRYEREVMPVEKIGNDIDFDKKISGITEKLLSYVPQRKLKPIENDSYGR